MGWFPLYGICCLGLKKAVPLVLFFETSTYEETKQSHEDRFPGPSFFKKVGQKVPDSSPFSRSLLSWKRLMTTLELEALRITL